MVCKQIRKAIPQFQEKVDQTSPGEYVGQSMKANRPRAEPHCSLTGLHYYKGRAGAYPTKLYLKLAVFVSLHLSRVVTRPPDL